jgi:hypothetical protein
MMASQGRLRIVARMGLLAALAGACERAPQPPVPQESPSLTEDVSAPSEPPVARAETLSIEGMPEVIGVREYEPPMGYPLVFRTLVPNDMAIDYLASGEAEVVMFMAAFGGVRREDARLDLGVLPSGTDRAEAESFLRALAESEGGRPRSESGRSWALVRYDLSGARSGFLALGQRRDHWYYFLAAYPPEFGDGLGPRIDLILRRWTWGDGTPLESP